MKGGYPSSWLRPSSRIAIYLRDGLCCVYCGAAGVTTPITVDHIVPRSKVGKGESNRATNLVTACQACNQLRRNYPKWTDFATHLGKSPSWLKKRVLKQANTEITQHIRNAALQAVVDQPLWLRQIKHAANPVNWKELMELGTSIGSVLPSTSTPDGTDSTCPPRLPCPWCPTLCRGCAGSGVDRLGMVEDDFY